MSVTLAFGILAGGACVAAVGGLIRYRTPLNPLTFFAIIEVGLFILFSGVSAYYLQPASYGPEVVAQTSWISMFYLLGGAVPYILPIRLLRNLYGKALRLLGLSSEKVPARFSLVKFGLLLGGGIGSFGALAMLGGGGLLWLTDTRSAYLSYRAGVGVFWLLTQWFLSFALIYYLWTRHPRRLRLVMVLAMFAAAAYLTGSKNNVMVILVIGIVYYHFLVKHIPLVGFVALLPVLALSILALMVIQGSFDSLLDAASGYFYSYFDTTAQFLARFNEFGFLYGKGMLSSFWFYVPRGLYPAKPFEYGAILFYETLFPGAAALGYTPGYLAWTLAYMDFGVVGVLGAGIVKGIGQRIVYEYFLMHKQKFYAFLFMLQFALWPVLVSASLALMVVWSVGQSVFIRLALKGHNVSPTIKRGAELQKEEAL